MDVKNLNTFIYVAELGSFTRAAERLNFSQSTVSFQIRQLETELGFPLFERINHTVVLTQKGREVLLYAHQIRKLTEEMKENVREDKQPAGHVRLAMADSLQDSLLRNGFRDFRRSYPEITLEIVAAGTEEMFRLLNHNEADIILTLDSHIYNADYVIVQEEKAEVHFVASKRNPLCREKRVSLTQLCCQDFILTEKGMSYRRIMDERLAELSMEIFPVLETGSTARILDLVEQGAGISFLPDYVTEAKVKAGELCRLYVEEFQVHVWKQLLYHRRKWISEPLKAVLDYCICREFSR